MEMLLLVPASAVKHLHTAVIAGAEGALISPTHPRRNREGRGAAIFVAIVHVRPAAILAVLAGAANAFLIGATLNIARIAAGSVVPSRTKRRRRGHTGHQEEVEAVPEARARRKRRPGRGKVRAERAAKPFIFIAVKTPVLDKSCETQTQQMCQTSLALPENGSTRTITTSSTTCGIFAPSPDAEPICMCFEIAAPQMPGAPPSPGLFVFPASVLSQKYAA